MTSGYAIATLVAFIGSIFFTVHPVFIPTPRPVPRLPINLITAPILAILLLWTTPCLDSAVVRHGIVGTEGIRPYNILVLFFSLAYMAITLDITGIVRSMAFWVSNKGGYNGWKLYLYFYAMLTILSILLGSDPIITSGTVYLIQHIKVANLDPRAWIIAGFAAVNSANMVLFVGNPTNVIICETLGINIAAFTMYTIPPFLACSFACFVVLVFQHRKQIPRKTTRITHQDPKSALLDPVGAWVGSFMLSTTLILCLVVSLFRIDIWTISFPFAVSKFLFDIGWDHYRYSRGIQMMGRGLPKDICGACEGDKDQGAEEILVYSPSPDEERAQSSFPTTAQLCSETPAIAPKIETQPPPIKKGKIEVPRTFQRLRSDFHYLHDRLDRHFPTFINALPRLPFALVPFILTQSILVEALHHQGWIDVFADWLIRASRNQLYATIWLIGAICIILCNLSGTNIGATILLTRIVRAAALPYDTNCGAAIALAVASNIGAVSFTFSASPSGLLWRAILRKEGIHVSYRDFVLWNLVPFLAMVTMGLGVASAEMAILFRS